MVSKSTSRKRRHTKQRLEQRSSLRLVQIDRRLDCWLLSELLTARSARHIEIRGTKQPITALRQLISSL